jgi:HEAT repeat protein
MSRMVFGALAVVLLATPAAAQQKASPPQPAALASVTAEGRPLSAWINDLKSPAPQTRNAAAYAISTIGPRAKAAVPALIAALDDPASSVRYPVCVALREIGPAAAAAVPKLEEVRDNDKSEDVAFMAKMALRHIQGETAEASAK